MNYEKPYVYINTLMDALDRVENVKNNILPFIDEDYVMIWPAIDGRTNQLEDFLKSKKNKFNINLKALNKNHYGCSRTVLSIVCSILSILEDAIVKNRGSIVFFEDDAKLKPNFYEKLEILIEQLPYNADYLKIHASHGLNNPSVEFNRCIQENCVEKFPPPKGLINGLSWIGADALFFTHQGIRKIFDLLKETSYSLDDFFLNQCSQNNLICYITRSNELCEHKLLEMGSYNKKSKDINRCSESLDGLLT